MASLQEISQRANVSVATASRVLNGSSHPVSRQTRAKVLSAAEALGYTPSVLAQLVRKGQRSRIIGVIVGDVSDPYFGAVARGVEEAVADHGYLTMISSGRRTTASELDHLRSLRDHQAAGVIFASSGYENDPLTEQAQELVDSLMASGSIVLTLAPRDISCSGQIAFDDRGAAFDATRYLIGLGHKEIAFVGGPGGLHTSTHRRDGFEAAVRSAGLTPNKRLTGGFEYEAGYSAAQHIALSPERPEAILAVNDDVAIGLVVGFRDAGLRVPADISVCGIHDTRPASYVGLTTVAVPLFEMGHAAGLAILNGETSGTTVLPHHLVERTTTAPSSARVSR